MDISDTLAPNSDQLDAVDLLGGPMTFTIADVSKGNAEQPVNIKLAEFPRPWRPGKSMRRVLVACWGPDASTYVGRRVTLFCDTTVKFGGQEVGGTRVSHLSHLDKPKKVPLLVTRGKSATYVVQPLPDAPQQRQDAMTGGEDFPVARNRQNAMFAAFGDRPDLADRQARLDYCANVLERPVESSKDLSAGDVERVINALKADAADGGEQA